MQNEYLNRQGQCAHIIESIETEKISKDELNYFWTTVDDLPNVDLRNLLATDEMRLVGRNSLSPLPLGRSFDMMLFSLSEGKINSRIT